MEIAAADEDEISGQLLRWSGLEGVWNEYELEGLFAFAFDVAFKCRGLRKSTRAWSNLPGHGGIWYTVSTRDPEALRAAMKVRLEALLRDHVVRVEEHRTRVRAAAAELGLRIAAGPERRLVLTQTNACFVIRQWTPDFRHTLSVSLADWADIESGEPIQYLDIPCSYEGLRFRETWRFNCEYPGSVWLGTDREVSFVASLREFAREQAGPREGSDSP